VQKIYTIEKHKTKYMMYSNTPNPPAKFTATMYGKTVTIELDHSDFDLSELMEIFKGLTIASGFEMTSWNNVIKDTASQIYDEEHEIVKEALNTDGDEDMFKDLRHGYLKDSEGYESTDELENDFFGTYNSDEKRMDIIGQNGNEGLHYEDDTKLKDYKGIHITRPTFDWDNETNDILNNINDSITLIKDRIEDIDMRMDNIDEQIGVLNADVANIELNIAFPPPNEHILQAKGLYDRAVKVHERDKEWRKDVVDMESGEVDYDEDGGFGGNKLNKRIIKRGKIKDLKK
jgi:hypothetical protein